MSSVHPTEDLPEYVAGSLDRGRAVVVGAHVARCDACATEVAAWRVLAGQVDPPDRRIVTAALRSASSPAVGAGMRWRLPLALAGAQMRLIPWSLWVVSVTALMVGGVFCRHHAEGFSLVVPLIVAMGVAAVADTGRDPVAEIARAARTSRRIVLLTRIWLVLLVDTAAAAAVPGLVQHVGGWAGGALVLAATAMLVALVRDAASAAAVVAVLWSVRVLADQDSVAPALAHRVVLTLWHTGPWAYAVGAVLAGAATILAGRGEPSGGRRTTTQA